MDDNPVRDRNTFDRATQGKSLRGVLDKVKRRREKTSRKPLRILGRFSETLEEKLGGGMGGSAKSLGGHALTGGGIGGGLALLIPFIGPALAPAAAAIGAAVGTGVYAVGKYSQPKDEEGSKEDKSYYQ